MTAISENITNTRISKENFNKQVFFCRIVFFLICGLIYVNYTPINSFISYQYSFIQASWIFRHDSFEPVLASITFFVLILTWYLIDRKLPYFHKYRIQNNNNMEAWMNRESAIYQEGTWYLLPILVIDQFIKRRVVSPIAPSLYDIIKDTVILLIMYDFLFFFGHVALHTSRFLYENVHRKHHTYYTVRAGDSIRHTFLDGTWDVLCSVISLNILRPHPLSRAIYNIVAISLIVEAHCGMNFPWMLHNLIPGQIVAGPVIHDIHHKYGASNFQKFFTYLDYLNGSLIVDDSQLPIQKRVNLTKKVE